MPTIKRSGEVTFDLNFDPTNASHGTAPTGLAGKVHADNPTDFRLVFPRIGTNGYRWAFSGYVTGFETSAACERRLRRLGDDQDHRSPDARARGVRIFGIS
ncbi:MAG: hypothetical protein M3N29_09385 [Chloroflexota bacterium]|nr:hypothetical protein [Chloroflexota bacterium]